MNAYLSLKLHRSESDSAMIDRVPLQTFGYSKPRPTGYRSFEYQVKVFTPSDLSGTSNYREDAHDIKEDSKQANKIQTVGHVECMVSKDISKFHFVKLCI